jgi:uncharacterized protein (TIGR02996 family)
MVADRFSQEPALARALGFLQRGESASARAALLEAWRDRRQPAIAALAELALRGAPDGLDARLAGIRSARAATSFERLRALGDLDDPRLASFALDALEHLPFTTPSAEDLLRELVRIVRRLGDRRLAPRAAAIRAGISARITRAPMRDRLHADLDDALAALPPDAPLTPEEMRFVKELEQLLAPRGQPAKTREALLAAVYENPLDDAPRLVLADWLQEHGDPWGEFIALQFEARARKLTRDEAAKATSLLKRHGKSWLGTLAPVVLFGKGYASTTFERGFLSTADLIISVRKKLELVRDDLAWGTVEELRGNWDPELLVRAPFRALKKLDRPVEATLIQTLARHNKALPAFTQLELRSPKGLEAETIAKVFPALATINVTLDPPTLAEVEAAVALGVRRVRIGRWVSHPESLAADRQEFEGLLAALERLPAHRGELALVPPFTNWPGSDAVELRPGSSGTWTVTR